MLAQTHRLIGKILCRIVSKSLDAKLHDEGFKYGCIKPDLVPRLLVIPHFKDKSFYFVSDLLKDIYTCPHSTSKKELKQLSIDLGVINHYLADYFCHAHNNKKYNRLYPHFLYENRLAKEFLRWELAYKNSNNLWSKTLIINTTGFSVQEIINYINKKHAEYLSLSPELLLDISFCIEVCATVTLAMVNHWFLEASPTAA